MAVWRTVGAAPIPVEVPLWLFGAIIVLIAVLIIGAGAIMVLGRWLKAPASNAAPSGGLLSQFRQMYEEGECSREEYELIRNRLGKRLRQELELPSNGQSKPADAKDVASPELPPALENRITEKPPSDRPKLPPL